MKNLKYICVFLLFFLLDLIPSNCLATCPESSSLRKLAEVDDFDAWCTKCQNPLNFNLVFNIVQQFNNTNHAILNKDENWLGSNWEDVGKGLTILSSCLQGQSGISINNPVLPHVQKLIFEPTNVGFVIGDIHGHFTDFCQIISDLITKGFINVNLRLEPGIFLFFLGDYVDRQLQGLEVLTTVMLLKLINPAQIFIIRGNHEERTMNMILPTDPNPRVSSFYYQLFSLYGRFGAKFHTLLSLIFCAYEFMFAAIYVGLKRGDETRWLHLSHGLMDIRYDPKAFLERLSTAGETCLQFDLITNNVPKIEGLEAAYRKISEDSSIENDLTFGFRWNDFWDDEKQVKVAFGGRGGDLTFSLSAIDNLFRNIFGLKFKNIIEHVIRGHQHILPCRYNVTGESPIPGHFLAEQKDVILKATTLISVNTNVAVPGLPGYFPTYLRVEGCQDCTEVWRVTPLTVGRS